LLRSKSLWQSSRVKTFLLFAIGFRNSTLTLGTDNWKPMFLQDVSTCSLKKRCKIFGRDGVLTYETSHQSENSGNFMLCFLQLFSGLPTSTSRFLNVIYTTHLSILRKSEGFGQFASEFTIALSPSQMARILFGSGSVTIPSMSV